MNRHTRRRVSSQPHLRWTLRFVVGFLAVTVALAYGGGISLAHWTTAIDAAAGVGTGSLTVEMADDGTEFDFECDSRTFPHDALSFVRFWAPDQTPGDLVSDGSGAVKIEEDGNETGDGYSIDRADASIGDPAAIHLGGSTVTVTEWIPKPGEPGEYIGFAYSVEGDPVTVDAKAATDLWRQVIAGSGVWSLDGIAYGGPTVVIESCDPQSSEIVVTISSVGSVPAMAYLTLAGGPGSAGCAAFESTILDAGGGVLDSGVLCDLCGSPLLVADQIDPGDAITVTIVLEPVFPLGSGVHSEAFGVEVVFTQWNSPLGSGYGWIDTASVPLIATLTATAPTPVVATASEPIPESLVSDPDTAPTEPDPEPEVAEPATASLTGLVWLDHDEDTATIPNDDEPGMDGVWVVLLDESGAEHSLVLTDADGFYTFEGLDPGRYVVGVRAPDSYFFPGVTTDAPDDILLDDGLAESLAAERDIDPLDVMAADIIRATTTLLSIVGWTAVVELAAGENSGLADAALTLTPVEPPAEPADLTDPDTEPPTDTPTVAVDPPAKEPEPDPFEETLPASDGDATGGAES